MFEHTKLCGQLCYNSHRLAELVLLMGFSCAMCSWSAGVFAQHVAPSMPEWLGWLQPRSRASVFDLNQPMTETGHATSRWAMFSGQAGSNHGEACCMTEISAGLQCPSYSLPPGLGIDL